jgi:Mg-chelatase subunit ChlI
MANTVKLHQGQTRAIGWYAVQRVRIADWLKPHHDKNQRAQGSSTTDKSPNSDESQSSVQSKEEKKSKGDEQKSEQSHEKILQKPSTTSKDAKKLKAVVRESHTILVKAHSVFPFQLFPDGINIDRQEYRGRSGAVFRLGYHYL